MIDERDIFDRAIRTFVPPDPAFERLVRRRDRKRRNQRIGAAVVAIAVALVTFAGLARDIRRAPRPATTPAPVALDPGTLVFIGEGMSPESRLYSVSADGSDLHAIPTGDLI